MEPLWVREARGLHPVGDVPPLLVDPPAEVCETPEALWEDAWPGMWEAVVQHADRTVDPTSLREIMATPAGSPVRADLLAAAAAPGPGVGAAAEERDPGGGSDGATPDAGSRCRPEPAALRCLPDGRGDRTTEADQSSVRLTCWSGSGVACTATPEPARTGYGSLWKTAIWTIPSAISGGANG